MTLGGWLNANSGAVQAVATVVLVGVTVLYAWLTRRYVQLTGKIVEEQRLTRESAARTADVRLSLRAFAVRKALADWIKRSRATGYGDDLPDWARAAIAFAEGLRKPLEQGLVDASAASPAAAASMQTAYAYWQRAVMRFEAYLTLSARLGGATSPADQTLLSDGVESSLNACYLTLEHVVEPALVAEAKQLGAWPDV